MFINYQDSSLGDGAQFLSFLAGLCCESQLDFSVVLTILPILNHFIGLGYKRLNNKYKALGEESN